MKRILILVAVLPSAALAQSPGTVDSFFDWIEPNETVHFGPLPSDFILTDLYGGETGIARIQISEAVDEFDATPAVKLWTDSSTRNLEFRSGVRFRAGKMIRVTASDWAKLTLSGYYDVPAGNVPAVSTWGLVALTLLIVSVGSVLIRRRGVV